MFGAHTRHAHIRFVSHFQGSFMCRHARPLHTLHTLHTLHPDVLVNDSGERPILVNDQREHPSSSTPLILVNDQREHPSSSSPLMSVSQSVFQGCLTLGELEDSQDSVLTVNIGKFTVLVSSQNARFLTEPSHPIHITPSLRSWRGTHRRAHSALRHPPHSALPRNHRALSP